MTYKTLFCAATGAVGAAIASFFGGWSATIGILLACMALDYFTAIIVAGVFHASPKSIDGGIESRAGFKGLCRKVVIIILVIISHFADVLLSTSYIRDMVAIAFCVNEFISIIENAGLMGIPIPTPLKKAITILHSKTEVDEDNADNPNTN